MLHGITMGKHDFGNFDVNPRFHYIGIVSNPGLTENSNTWISLDRHNWLLWHKRRKKPWCIYLMYRTCWL